MELIFILLVVVATAAVTAATFLPFVPSHAWWIRAMDIPRAQVAAAVGLTALVAFFLPAGPRIPVMIVLAASLAVQIWKITPYSSLFPKEVRFASPGRTENDVTFLSSNVQMGNDRYEDVRDLIRRDDPDVLFLMETDQRWIDEITPVLDGYETIVSVPLDNYYGMLFATRLETNAAKALRITDSKTPALFAELVTRGGRVFRLAGLHPRPPVVGEDTDERDAQILYAARFARDTDIPVVALGDFNSAAWSRTSLRFKHAGGYIDPRIGRGMVASFDANRRWLRCPIDQLYITPDVAVVAFGRGPAIGSDHFPMHACLRFDPETAASLNRHAKPVSQDEDEEIEAEIRNHKTRMGEHLDTEF